MAVKITESRLLQKQQQGGASPAVMPTVKGTPTGGETTTKSQPPHATTRHIPPLRYLFRGTSLQSHKRLHSLPASPPISCARPAEILSARIASHQGNLSMWRLPTRRQCAPDNPSNYFGTKTFTLPLNGTKLPPPEPQPQGDPATPPYNSIASPSPLTSILQKLPARSPPTQRPLQNACLRLHKTETCWCPRERASK